MFCTTCGTPLSEDSKFCVNCGIPVDSDSSALVQPIPQDSSADKTPSLELPGLKTGNPREILTESPTPIQPNSTISGQPTAKETLSNMQEIDPFTENTSGNALAGAFPEWNLVPATPFIRRVK